MTVRVGSLREPEGRTLTAKSGSRAPGVVAEGPRSPHRRPKVDWQGYLYIFPALVLFAIFVLAPLVQTVILSLFDSDGILPPEFVGAANYIEMIQDSRVIEGYLHSVILILYYCVLPIFLALLLSAMLARRPIKGFGLFRAVLFLPQVVSTVVVGIIWRFIYAPDGPLNAILRLAGLGQFARPWLADFSTSLPAIGFVGTWILTGLCLVLFLTGMQQIPTELYDAARVDGAGPVREFFAVTLPALRNVTVVAVALTLIAALRTFDLVYVTTRGGPGTSSIIPGILVYENAFDAGRQGYAAAVATGLMIVVFLVTMVVLRRSERKSS